MAKLKRGFVQMSGQYGDAVYVNSRKYGYHIRKAPAAGLKKDEPALALQYGRTRFLNALASEVNKLMTAYFQPFKSASFYHSLQKCFRREPLNNRFLLLRHLKGLDLNPAYPLGKLGSCSLTTKLAKRQLRVQLQVNQHPAKGRYQTDCYYYELALFCWGKSGGVAQADWQLSNWISLNEGRPGFEFHFTIPPGTLHWMLCLRQQLGINKKEVAYFAAQGVQIVEVGSFDKGDMAILEERMLAITARPATKVSRKVLPGMGRVAAKRYL
jgi:hypothetical protein